VTSQEAPITGWFGPKYQEAGVVVVLVLHFATDAARGGELHRVVGRLGFLGTVEEGETRMFFESPTSVAVADAFRRLRERTWNAAAICAYAERFAKNRFFERMRAIAGVETGLAG
jgi:hypothetical protein